MKTARMGSQQKEQAVIVTGEGIALSGFLAIPPKGKGIVLFAHGSGSGRFSPRNRFVAQQLQHGRIATLLIDLLTTEEEEDRRNVFDIDLLADRVLMVSAWLRPVIPSNYRAIRAADVAAALLQAVPKVHGVHVMLSGQMQRD